MIKWDISISTREGRISKELFWERWKVILMWCSASKIGKANKEVTKREIKFNSCWRLEQTSKVCQISLDKKSGVKEAMTGVDDSVEGRGG